MPGRLEVICGPMFAGKSTELLRRIRAAVGGPLDLIAFKPERDTRSGSDCLRTHAGDTFPAIPLLDAARLIHSLPSKVAHDRLLMAVDEAHFFGEALLDPVRQLVARGTRVIIAGVERDHRGLPFEPFPALLCEADEVLKFAARCAVCGGEAVHSQRMITSDAPILVGGAEAYEARCRACFQPGA